MNGISVVITTNREAKLESEITTSGEGEQCDEPLDQSQETPGFLQRLWVKWHFLWLSCPRSEMMMVSK